MTLGKYLRNARTKAGKSLGEASRHLGVSVVYLSDIERDRSLMEPEALVKLLTFIHGDPTPPYADILWAEADRARKAETALRLRLEAAGPPTAVEDWRAWVEATPDASDLIREIMESGLSIEFLRNLLTKMR